MSLLPDTEPRPFAVMGAAQTLIHQNRFWTITMTQARAMLACVRRLPEIAQYARPGGLASAANERKTVAINGDRPTKPQIRG